MAFYFDRFEQRRPPEPLPYSAARETLWQFLATVNLTLGLWYICWRWTASLNTGALWFALPLVIAETGAYIGLVLFTINLWKDGDYRAPPPPASIRECVEDPDAPDRPISVDVFFTTYNEDPELVRLGLRDARAVTYPHALDLRVHVLDDGRRPEMRRVAEEEGVGYITRTNNAGFKAGNLRNAMEQTSGDFIVICDADTRPFPTILADTLGHFRDPAVAFVQTPQWFYDLPEGEALSDWLGRRLGHGARRLGRAVERAIGPVRLGEDPFVNDPQMFYDVILRRRNWANAAFCCGAASIQRREAVMEAALKAYADAVSRNTELSAGEARRLTGEEGMDEGVRAMMLWQAALEQELTPYKFHVSEDIYTSIVLHGDRERRWKSVLHPKVESKMLSPQDLLTWTIQRFKYAGGSLDILFNDNPLIRHGLSLPQKLMYGSTFWSYLGAIWNLVFLLSPVVYLFTGVSPVAAYSFDFFKHILPFLVANELATMVGTWGIPGYKSKASYLSFFPVNLRALWTVLRGQKIKFPVTPKDRQEGNFLHVVTPQLSVIVLTVAALAFAGLMLALGSPRYTLGGLIANGFWGLNNILAMSGIVRAALWRPDDAAEGELAAA